MFQELITNLFQTIDARNWDEMTDFFCVNVVYERPGYDPIEGIERLSHFYQYERVIAFGNHDLEHILIEGDHGSCCGRFIGRKKDGSALNELFADVYTFEEGKIKMRRSYFFRPAI